MAEKIPAQKPEEGLKDYNQKPLTVADVQEQTRLYLARIQKNSVELAGIVRGKSVSQPKPKIDRKTNEPIIDAHGNPDFWPPYYYVTIAFEGGELDISVEKDWYENIQLNTRISLTGFKGLRYGRVDDVFTHFEVI